MRYLQHSINKINGDKISVTDINNLITSCVTKFNMLSLADVKSVSTGIITIDVGGVPLTPANWIGKQKYTDTYILSLGAAIDKLLEDI